MATWDVTCVTHFTVELPGVADGEFTLDLEDAAIAEAQARLVDDDELRSSLTFFDFEAWPKEV